MDPTGLKLGLLEKDRMSLRDNMLLEQRNRLVINSECWRNTVCPFEQTCYWN